VRFSWKIVEGYSEFVAYIEYRPFFWFFGQMYAKTFLAFRSTTSFQYPSAVKFLLIRCTYIECVLFSHRHSAGSLASLKPPFQYLSLLLLFALCVCKYCLVLLVTFSPAVVQYIHILPFIPKHNNLFKYIISIITTCIQFHSWEGLSLISHCGDRARSQGRVWSE